MSTQPTQHAKREAEIEIDDLIRAALRKLSWRHPHWPAEIHAEIGQECEGEIYLVEDITQYWEVVQLVAEMNEASRPRPSLWRRYVASLRS